MRYLLIVVAFLAAAVPAAASLNTIELRATRTALLADGKQSTDLIAAVLDSTGRPVANGTEVEFQTTLGTLDQPRAQTFAGSARVRLSSSTVTGVAHVTAFTAGGASSTLDILITDDPADIYTGNNYMVITGKSYLGYSAIDHIVQAEGRNGGARLIYRTFDITADTIQLRCMDGIIRARDNITLKRGSHVVHASRLYYSLYSGQGYAIAQVGDRLKPVALAGQTLQVNPSPGIIPQSYIRIPELSTKLVITARSITYIPNDRLQFRRAKFYQELIPLMSMPYYQLALNSEQLFTDQFISLGTSGFGLDVPYYYNLTPSSTGIVYLRHQEQIGRGYYSYEPGWAIDVSQGYQGLGATKYEGSFAFTGLTRSDWGFRWLHNQEINSLTSASIYLDFPYHDSVVSSLNLNQQAKWFHWGADMTAGQTWITPEVSNYRTDLYAETQAHPIPGLKNMQYTLGTTFTTGTTINPAAQVGPTSAATGTTTTPTVTPGGTTSAGVSPGYLAQTSEGFNVRAYSRPIILDKLDTLNESFTLGHAWGDNGAAGMTGLATVGVEHSLGKTGRATLTYDYISEPTGLFASAGKHRLSLTFSSTSSKRWTASVFGSAFLDSADNSLIGDLTYRINGNWRLLVDATLQRFEGESFDDIELTIGRRFGARELQLTYSTYLNRVSLDFTATRF